jgi:signal transduction histidine kinase
MSEDRRSKGMYHSLIGKPSLRVVLVMGLLIGLCLLSLAACGGEESAKGGAGQEHNKRTSAGTAPTDGQMGATGGSAATNGQIAFGRHYEYGQPHSAIFAMNLDGSHVSQITHLPEGFRDDFPEWSADGQRLAFVRQSIEDAHIVGSYTSGMKWKPIMSLGDESMSRIMILNTETGDARQVVGVEGFDPAFSPDGHSLAFRRPAQISIVGLDGSGLHRVTNKHPNRPLAFSDFGPAFSPDGKMLVFERSRLADDHTAVFVQSLASSGSPEDARQITPWQMGCGDGPEFSPKGDWVLFSCEGEGGSHLYWVHPNGTGLEQLTNAPFGPDQPDDVDYVGSSFSPEFRGAPFSNIVAARYPAYGDEGINRTLVYGSLSACVIGIYVLAVVALGALFQAQGNFAISLLATGLAAVLFQPLRNRLQRGVNRLMYGERDDPYAVISRLGRSLEATLAPEAVLPTVVQTIAQALKLPYAAILLKDDIGYRTTAAYGSPTAEPEALPLVYQREEIGRLEFSPRAPGEGFSDADRSLLEDLARQAEVAVHAVRLTSDLQHSRERLVTTREEERRRLRRDLHDGLGAQLAGLNVQAGTLRRLIPRDPDAADDLVVELREELRSAIADIRRLVYDLRPPALDDLGLAEALRRLAEHYGSEREQLSVLVEVPEDLPNLPAAVEVAVYRIVQEALTNVARHAQAHSCVVRLAVNEEVGLEIVDDGVGIPAECSAGVGLSSMRERASELGGSCVVERAPEGGTRVLVRLPLPKESPKE